MDAVDEMVDETIYDVIDDESSMETEEVRLIVAIETAPDAEEGDLCDILGSFHR